MAHLSYGRPVLVKAEVLKETPKLFKLGEVTPILGGRTYWRQIQKDDPTVFEDPEDALKHIVELLKERLRDLEAKNNQAWASLRLVNKLQKEFT